MTTAILNHGDATKLSPPADAVLAWHRTRACDRDDPGDAAEGAGIDILFNLGVALSTGSHGQPCDLVEAHKWFNIAASAGHAESARCRADLAREMTAREVAEAQRRARSWLGEARRAA